MLHEQHAAGTRDQMQNSFSVLGFSGCSKEMSPDSRDREQFHRFLTHTTRLGAKWCWINKQPGFRYHDSASGPPQAACRLLYPTPQNISYCVKGAFLYHPGEKAYWQFTWGMDFLEPDQTVCVFLVTALLKYNSHATQCTHLKSTNL